MNKSQKLAKSKLIKSLIVQFPRCSMKDAYEWADNIIASESQTNGRIGNFEEISENVSAGKIGDDLSEQVKARAKGKAGIKSFRNRAEIDELKLRIAYRGGVRS